ncbi:MAG TPA: hypothetical protein VHW00_18050 [Thermoanaerobaculia bacterium]|nr:hypothetical protein [Thermoanaerobaculia bacterium]
MSRYLQRIALLGKERWIGWEVDGVGTEIPGLMLADDLSDDEIRARGVKEFRPMPFENFVSMGLAIASPNPSLHEQDIEYRLDALLVGMERIRSQGQTAVPRSVLLGFLGDATQLTNPLVIARFREWQAKGKVDIVSADACYLRIKGRLA